ncbi:MAG: formylglycine-generating enzyme family protein [Candidatus Limnocylindria bacterium]
MPVDEPETIVIPPGDALLGDPVRTEHVNVFAIAARPVTNAEYARFREGHTPTDDRPVRGVTWADAVGYCRWLTTSTGHIWRLPDEREWEKAARTGVLEDMGELEWTNSWAAAGAQGSELGGRVLRGREDPAKRRYVLARTRPGAQLTGEDERRTEERSDSAPGDLSAVGFRVVRGMTGR